MMCYTCDMKTPDQEQPTEMSEACASTPMGRAIRLIGDAWVLLIIINLLRGPKRFNELQTYMGHISSKTLTQRLRALEELGMLERRAFLEIPPRVEYHLTEKGQEFGEIIAAIELFAERNLSDIDEAPSTTEPRSDQRTTA
jgi:DNA-binding HxlR family transcriptional regulator